MIKKLNNVKSIVSGNSPLISVIVPIYNTEEYLEKCVYSIINQKYKHIEIILVNDGSTDKSGEICDFFESIDTRVKVIHKQNGGLSSARNAGINISNGDYLGFVDSDDWIVSNMYKNLLKLAMENKADMVRCEFLENENEPNVKESTTQILKKNKFMPLILTDIVSSHMVICIFSRKLFDQLEFPIGYIAEDMMIFHLLAGRANKLVMTNKQLYYYYNERVDNISNSTELKFDNTMHRAIAFKNRYIYSIDRYPDVQDDILKRTVRFILASFCRVPKNLKKDSKDSNDMNILYNFINYYETAIISSKSISIIEKISIKLILLNRTFFIRLCRVFNMN